MIHIVGLGPGDPEALPARARALLGSGLPVFLRTARHPTVVENAPYVSFDAEYERADTFAAAYAAIVERLLAAHSERGAIVYAVPGHPLVGESTVAQLLPLARERGIDVEIVPAPSFVDACLQALGEAVTGDLHVLDALSLSDPEAGAPRFAGPLLLYQVHGRQAASEAKLALMRAGYPDDFAVTVVRAAGVPGRQSLTTIPLYALDRTDAHDHLTSVWVPPLAPALRRPAFPELVGVMARLRAPDGCPWDREQTHETLRRYVLEEAYEVVEAVDGGDPDKLCEELGDLLLQVVFHAQLAAEAGAFTIDDVCQSIVDKLVRRHPHVFGDLKVSGADEVLTNWQAIKAGEPGNAERTSVLDGIPRSLPALLRALEVSKRAVRVGFEWPDTPSVLDKVDEEIAELRAEIAAEPPDRERIADELGDLLFTVVNVARRVGVEPEEALRRQLGKFDRRFRHIEAGARRQGVAVDALSPEAMERLWQEAKTRESEKEDE